MDINDKVTVVATYSGFYGCIGVITEIMEDSTGLLPYTVEFTYTVGDSEYVCFSEDELELVN